METMAMNEQQTIVMSGARTIFNGTNSQPVFAAQTVPLPALASGEILVKVMNIR
jgi:hypothetical protein